MRAVKSCDTKPEMVVRQLLHGMGYRYRLHRARLAGKTAILFPSRRCVIFVHGCFWHGQNCTRGDRLPATNIGYWEKKIACNVERYSTMLKELRDDGWTVLTPWECEMADVRDLKNRLKQFLPGRARCSSNADERLRSGAAKL